MPLAFTHLLILLTTLVAPIARAKSCQTETSALLKKLKSRDIWTLMNAADGSKVSQTPTEVTGAWIIKIESATEPLKIKLVQPRETLVYRLDGNCQESVSTEESNVLDFKKIAAKPKNYFTDENLNELIRFGRGVIYVWSPRFVYSVEKFAEVKKLAQDQGLTFTAILTRDTSPAELKNAQVKKINAPIVYNASIELLMQKSDLHLPTLFIYSKGKLADVPVVGIYTTEAMKSLLRDIP